MTAVTLWPLGIYFLLVVILVAAMLGASYLLGQRHEERDTDFPYGGVRHWAAYLQRCCFRLPAFR